MLISNKNRDQSEASYPECLHTVQCFTRGANEDTPHDQLKYLQDTSEVTFFVTLAVLCTCYLSKLSMSAEHIGNQHYDSTDPDQDC